MIKPLYQGVIASIVTVVIYLVIIVLTTPALEPLYAIYAAFQLNIILIVLMSVGVGLQIWISGLNRAKGCRVKGTLGKNIGGATTTSFFSFFSLIPLGCCGWWLYALSLLPSIVGTGISGVLITHSTALSYVGLVIIYIFVGLGLYQFKKENQ